MDTVGRGGMDTVGPDRRVKWTFRIDDDAGPDRRVKWTFRIDGDWRL